MRVPTSDRFERRTRGLGLVALGVLAWSVFASGGVFWTAVVVSGLSGSAAATALLVRNRRIPSLAQVIASAEAEAVVGQRAGKA